MLVKVNLWEKFLLNIKSSLVNKNDMEEINEVVKLLAVSLYYDKKVTEMEEKEAQKIIHSIFDADSFFVLQLVNAKIDSYVKEFWCFKKDSDYVLKKIIDEGNWTYAEYMVNIFEADGVSSDENKVIGLLSQLVNTRKILFRELGLE